MEVGISKGFPKLLIEWDGKRLIRTYDVEYLVIADDDTQGPITIVSALPYTIGDPLDTDPYARCKRIGPTQRERDGKRKWTIPLFFTTQFSDEDATEAELPPNQRRCRHYWSYETIQVLHTQDAVDLSNYVTNSAQEPYDELIDVTIPVLTVERFEDGFDESIIINYANHVNINPFYGAPANTVLCAGIETDDEGSNSSGNEIYNGTLYQKVRYVFKFKIPITEDNKGWLSRLPDIGTRYLDGATYKAYLTDADPTVGKRERIVGPLDGAGGKKTPGDPVTILEFNQYPTADFNLLQLC